MNSVFKYVRDLLVLVFRVLAFVFGVPAMVFIFLAEMTGGSRT